MKSSYVADVSETDFQEQVLERSHEVPVVVDFWAEWCGPCRILGPILERLAGEADGGWVLAKVDVDSNPRLSAAAGVQGIPAVRAFKDGREVAEFTGALPEPQVREWLKQLGPSSADLLVSEGRSAEAAGDLAGAAELYRGALDHEPGDNEARSLLAAVDMKLRTASLDEESLRTRLESDPTDVDAATGLADIAAASGDFDRAFDLLLDVVRLTSDEERDRARIHLLTLLEALPISDPRAIAARRALSLVLF
ncbi:MAG: tetratricopeptide repeat protein [Actinomycetota bacterium]